MNTGDEKMGLLGLYTWFKIKKEAFPNGFSNV